MARIREYSQQTSVAGEVGGRRATPEDFGFGSQMMQFGETLQRIGVDMRQEADRRELEDASVKMAQARQQWTETYLRRQQEAQPGDMSMAPTMRDEMNTYFTEMSGNYTSPAARKYVQMHGTSMTTDFFSRGLQYQQVQAGQKARADHAVRVDTSANVVYTDPMQYSAVRSSILFDIQNGVGAYAYLQNAPDRAKLEAEAVSKIAWSAAMKAAEDPSMRAFILGRTGAGMQMSDEELAKQTAKMQEEGMSAQEIANFMKAARPSANVQWAGKDGVVAEGKLDTTNLPAFMNDLTPQAQMQVLNQMRSYQRQEDAVARAALKQQVENHLAYVGMTGQAPPQQLSRIDFKNDQAGWDTYQASIKAADALTGVWSMPFAEGQKVVESLKPSAAELADPAFANKVKIYEQAQRIFADRVKAIAADNIAADMNSKFAPGTGGIKKLTTADPTKWLDELEVRAPQARASAQTRRLPLRMLSNDEAKEMGQRFEMMTAEEQMGFLSGVGTKFEKDPDSIRVLMRQIAQGKSGVAAVGDLMYAPAGAKQNNEPRDQTAGNILLGTQLMSRPVGRGMESEKGAFKQQMPTMADAEKVLGSMSEFKNVSQEFTASLPQLMETVTAHYVGKLARQGVTDLSISKNQREFKDSVLTVLGKPQTVGSTKVLKPYGMEDSDFLDAVRKRVDAPWGTYGLRQPLTAPPTIYEVVQGNRVVGMIDLSKAPTKTAAEIPATTMPPATTQRPPTFEERTGQTFYGQANRELGEMVGNVTTEMLENLSTGWR